MVNTGKEPLLFSSATYGCMIVSAVGLLATVVSGMGDPSLRMFATALLCWMMVAIAAFVVRMAASLFGTMNAQIAQIESVAQQQ